jgi:beta-galactosidase
VTTATPRLHIGPDRNQAPSKPATMQLTSEAGVVLPIERAATISEHDNSTNAPDWCNEKVFQRNRLPSRSYYIPDTSLSLNGTWAFTYSPTPFHAPTGETYSSEAADTLIDQDRDNGSRHWGTIAVPGHWQLQGYGRPQYTNFVYPFPTCPPYAPSENPTGTYFRAFEIPSTWLESSHLRLRFDGVDSAFYVWVNGIKIGYSQGSRNPAEFDITGQVTRGAPNHLVVQVLQWCSGSYIEDQDQWWLSGESFSSLLQRR